jgi:hypothetical protein
MQFQSVGEARLPTAQIHHFQLLLQLEVVEGHLVHQSGEALAAVAAAAEIINKQEVWELRRRVLMEEPQQLQATEAVEVGLGQMALVETTNQASPQMVVMVFLVPSQEQQPLGQGEELELHRAFKVLVDLVGVEMRHPPQILLAQ